jgi:flagellar hook-associated protein 1 FlgK
MATLLGLGADKVQNTAGNLQVNPTIAADNALLALGRLQVGLVGEIAITPGDNRGAFALAAAGQASVSFNAAGNLAAHSNTLVGYAAVLVGDSALYAAGAEDLASDFTALFNALNHKSQSLSGVNVDEELAYMIVLQNAFSASARLIATVDEMFDDLLSIVF